MIHKLRRKFIAVAMLSVTLVMLLMGVSINVVNFISTNNSLNETLMMIYENEGTVPQSPGSFKPGDARKGRFTPETPFSTRYFVLRYTDDGALLNANMKHIAAVTEEDVEDYLEIAQQHGEGFGFAENYKFFIVHDESDKCMAIFLDCYDELHTIRAFALVSLLVILCCVILVFVLVLFFSRRAIAPTIQSMEKQKQFITDASHELKTPLTVIATSLKVLEMDTGKNKWIDKIESQTEKLTGLVNDLVTLSRLDEEKPPLHMSRFNISAVAEETAESFREHAALQGHPLTLQIAPGLSYCGDEYAVRQLLSILLDNAVKYTDPGGEIALSLSRRKNALLLQVSNPCAGLDAAQLEKLFDRFYRADPSRSSQTGGFGIGLSIAQSIVEAHHGTIQAAYLQPGTIQFIVTLKERLMNNRKPD
ncbi:MAG: sensor histidine kinase [Butyricicoccus sp.]